MTGGQTLEKKLFIWYNNAILMHMKSRRKYRYEFLRRSPKHRECALLIQREFDEIDGVAFSPVN